MLILALLCLLLVPYLMLAVIGTAWPELALEPQVRGRVSLALVFMFTASGHFAKGRPMSDMLPSWVRGRLQIVYATGALEIAGAIGLLVPHVYRLAGMCLIAFLVAVFPANIYAAVKRVDFGGHAEGPAYLWARAPLQLVLVAWTYWFAVR